jgi:thiol-disulfide isomerase/thioredoxin
MTQILKIIISSVILIIFTSLSEAKQAQDSLFCKIIKVDDNDILPVFKWKLNGFTYSSEDFKGKVIFPNSRTTWCQPCINEMPELSNLNNELKDSGFIMVGINVFPKTKTLNLTEFLLENSVSYSILEGNDDIINAFSRTYGEEINVISTIFIINKKERLQNEC